MIKKGYICITSTDFELGHLGIVSPQTLTTQLSEVGISATRNWLEKLSFELGTETYINIAQTLDGG